MKAVVVAFNQEKALVGAFSVITNLGMELFEALIVTAPGGGVECGGVEQQRGQAQGQPPPVEEALLDDEEHGGGLQQQEAAPPRHTGGEAPG